MWVALPARVAALPSLIRPVDQRTIKEVDKRI
jgi:hypothetical protein